MKSMKITIISATDMEVKPILDYLEATFERKALYRYHSGTLEIDVLVTGVGSVPATYGLTKYLAHNDTDQLICIGVGGILSKEVALGEVFLIEEQYFYDLGVKESDGTFRNLFELGLMDPDLYPFRDSSLRQEGIDELSFLPKVKGITVNTVSGAEEAVASISANYQNVMESMEGAAFAYVALSEQMPYLEIRAASNYIELRDRNKWELELAVERLGEVLQSMIASWKAASGDRPTPE